MSKQIMKAKTLLLWNTDNAQFPFTWAYLPMLAVGNEKPQRHEGNQLINPMRPVLP